MRSVRSLAPLLVFCLAVCPSPASSATAASAGSTRDFAGFYEFDRLQKDGEGLRATLHLRIFNFSDLDVPDATVQVAGTSLSRVTLPRRESVLLDIPLSLPRDRFAAWLRGRAPRITVSFRDGAGQSTLREVEMVPMRLGGAHADAVNRRDELSTASALAPSPASAAHTVPVTTVAGGGPSHVPATTVALGTGLLAIDPTGNLYIAGAGSRRIFGVDRSGQLTVEAGSGADFHLLDAGTGSGPALDALFGTFTGLMTTGSGEILALDYGYHFGPDETQSTLRRVDRNARLIDVLLLGFPYACSSFGIYLTGMAGDGSGRILISDETCATVWRFDPVTGTRQAVAGNGVEGFSGDGGPATEARLLYPAGLALDAAGNLYVNDRGNFRIRRVEASTGIITTVAGNGTYGGGPDGVAATGTSIAVGGFTVDGAGDLYIADVEANRIRRVDAGTGIITSIAGTGDYGFSGDGGPASAASFAFPGSLVLDAAGHLFVMDAGNGRVRRIDAVTGLIATVAGGGSPDPGDGRSATDAVLRRPARVEVDPAGNLLIIDTGHARVRRLDSLTGTITTVAGGGAGGDGTPANEARLDSPTGIVSGPTGDLYISEAAGRVRKVEAASGIISTLVASGLVHPTDVTLDATGALYVSDRGGWPDSDRVFRVSAAGGLTTVAGGGADHTSEGIPAAEARLLDPVGLGADAAGDLYITEESGRVRRVRAATGTIETVAGSLGGSYGDSGDAGPATDASLHLPSDVVPDAAGDLYISTRPFTTDSQFFGHVRRVDAATSIIDTMGSALGSITGVALDTAGNLFFADADNNRVRRLSLVSSPPAAVAGPDLVAECGAGVVLDGSGSTDADSSPGTNDDIASFEWLEGFRTPGETRLGSGERLGVNLTTGRHDITLVVTDSHWERRADQMLVEVRDTLPPALSIDLGPTSLWPPNHRMVPVSAAVSAVELCGASTISLVSITSNEPDDAPGKADGKTLGDIQGAQPGTADFEFLVRAERSSTGTGRVYTVTYSATDDAGNLSTAATQLVVPITITEPGSAAAAHDRAPSGRSPTKAPPRR